jgi:NADPH:quinone reductase-like Zn-dependent oxidoreductase
VEPSTSKAVVFDAYDDPDVLHTVDADPPKPGPGEIRVRVKAAGLARHVRCKIVLLI